MDSRRSASGKIGKRANGTTLVPDVAFDSTCQVLSQGVIRSREGRCARRLLNDGSRESLAAMVVGRAWALR